MAPFSFLRTRRKRSQPQTDDRDPASSSLDHVSEPTDKLQRRQSKRDFLRTLVKKPVGAPESRPGWWRNSNSHSMKPDPYQLQPPRSLDNTNPSSPMSGTNKPLPPPPPPGPHEATESPPKPVVKLARIIAPIAPPDLHKLFSGAPQFYARSEGHHTGAPHPSVAFPWNTDVDTRDLRDHIRIQDEAWGCVTAWPHITVQKSRDPEATKEHHRKQRAHFLPRCRERPNMLSMQGIERGTVGYAAALEMGVADALRIPPDDPEESPNAILDHRKDFLNTKEGLRPLTDSTLIDRLISASTAYHDDPMKHQRPTIELYTDLFTQILYPPSRVTDSQDPYSLQVQIEVLIDVLAAPYVWIDFGLVEYRIRLGQILWGHPESDLGEDSPVNSEVMHESGTQKYWLLLQILLASELLLRLDALSMNMDKGLEAPKLDELRRFDKSATMSVRWSIILARQWLENIKIERKDSDAEIEKKTPPGWLASLTGRVGSTSEPVGIVDHPKFEGRNQTRQLAGLVHFASKLRWPNMETLAAKVSANDIEIPDSARSTPAMDTPLSVSTQQSTSYFSSRRPEGRWGSSMQKNATALLRPSGWLSSSYINGLILPGEGLSHFLMSTLLENDEVAVSILGDEANLYGGFIYCGRSFWSTACIVGRVVAASEGGRECMGWISSEVVPRGSSEGWVDIDVEVPLEHDSDIHNGVPRIWHKIAIETSGSVVGGADASSVLPGDFVSPSDDALQKSFSVTFESLNLFSEADSETDSTQDPTPPTGTEVATSTKIKTYSAMMRFIVATDVEEKREVNLALSHDVQFVTAHPCVASPYTDILKTPTSPLFRTLEQGSIKSSSVSSNHPLHKAFTYTRIHILDLLSTSSSTSFNYLLLSAQITDPTLSSTHTTSSTIPKVLVVDCTDSATADLPPPGVGHKRRSGSDIEMMARALCAERGWNALVSRRGRSCLACAIREAGALGWRVILRLC
ncbi:Uncharacterized protein BP5553_04452 [Venustampulla echinocandica]|uniref:Uncharacterized protein n=1 Tax=Venustampulla echinocandica TaxID=2656787 RepID=A0A370TNC4_9HELO|nr:Uncharacterized protein BP5553_04452 [Venustampulla echinocandica]RDL37019.1 Uncharacterized protein BP5553_04452 [Venustampulla echinocandica]